MNVSVSYMLLVRLMPWQQIHNHYKQKLKLASLLLPLRIRGENAQKKKYETINWQTPMGRNLKVHHFSKEKLIFH